MSAIFQSNLVFMYFRLSAIYGFNPFRANCYAEGHERKFVSSYLQRDGSFVHATWIQTRRNRVSFSRLKRLGHGSHCSHFCKSSVVYNVNYSGLGRTIPRWEGFVNEHDLKPEAMLWHDFGCYFWNPELAVSFTTIIFPCSISVKYRLKFYISILTKFFQTGIHDARYRKPAIHRWRGRSASDR